MKRGDWLNLQPGDLIRHKSTVLGMVTSVRRESATCRVVWRLLNAGNPSGNYGSYPSYDHAGKLTDDEAAWVMKRNLT